MRPQVIAQRRDETVQQALEGFAFTMLIGIVSGTYSTVFITSAIRSVSVDETTGGGRTGEPPSCRQSMRRR
jgi:hypothetical protein